MATRKTPAERHAALQQAYDDLNTEGAPVTVQALRRAARVDTKVAGDWLRAKRKAESPNPGAPDGLFDAVNGRIWDAAIEAARKVSGDEHAQELLTAHDATASARTDAERAVKRADALQSKVDRLTEQLAAGERSLDDARVAQGQLLRDLDRAHADLDRAAARADAAEQAAADAERRAASAELDRARTEAELAALREVLSAFKPDGNRS